MSDVVLTEKRDGVLIITLNRPEAGNAIIPAVTESVDKAFEVAEADPEISAVVVTGAGQKIFCAGLDLRFMATASMEEVAKTNSPVGGFAGLTQRKCSKPVICAVNGAAMGGGTEIALAADIVVASEKSTFGLPEVKRGLIAGAGGPIMLAHKVPRTVALEMLLTGRAFTAEEAKSMFLINRVVPADKVLDEAIAIAAEIASNAPLSVRTAKEIYEYACANDEDAAWKFNAKAVMKVQMSADAKEGPKAFAQKRKPVWTGK